MTLGDAELGSEKLGTAITESTLPEPAESPRDRASDVLKSAFTPGDDSTWDKFLTTVTDEFEAEYAAIRQVEAQRDIDTAVGEPLEKIGRQFHVNRRHGEADPHLRRRIKLQLPKHTTSATLDEIIDASTLLLDCDPAQLELHETFDIEPGRFDVFIREQVLKDADVTVSQYVNLIQEVKGGGIRAVATIGKQFTHRSVYEANNGINDTDRSYANEDGTIQGGPYADMITARHRTPSDFDEEPAPKKPDYDGLGEGRFGESIFGA